MVYFKTSWTLDSYLVRAVIHPLQRTICSMKCSKKQWKVCKNVQNPDIFQSSVTFERFKTNQQLTCGDKGLAYLFTCKAC